MSRAVLPLLCGALLGGAVVYLANRAGGDAAAERTTSDTSSGPTTASSRSGPALNDEIADRSGDLDNADIDARDSTLDSLLTRAAFEPETLLDEIRGISPPGRQREIALAVLAALGNDDASIQRVAAALPAADRTSFRIDALAARAATDPGSALRSALALDSSAARNLAIPLIAEAAAAVYPTNALAQAALIGNRELRTLYLVSIAGVWARTDSPEALAWITAAVSSDLPAASVSDALAGIAANDRDLLLASVESMPLSLQPLARHAAIVTLAESDPRAAIAEIDRLTPGRNRTELEAAVAEVYALENPEAAVEWALARPDAYAAIEGAIRSAAAVDFDEAVDLAIRVAESGSMYGAYGAYALAASGAGAFDQFVERLLASHVDNLDQHFSAAMVRWPQVDSEAALDWALDNAGRLDRNSMSQLSYWAGYNDPERANVMLERLAPDARKDWISGVARGMGAVDTDRALAFLEQHRGAPGFDEGLYGVVDSLANSDPAAAARLVERTGAQAAGRVGWTWAQQDAVAARNWIAGLEDAEMRRDAIGNYAANSSRANATATIDWLLGLPADSARDYGLQSAVQAAVAATGSIDVQALNAIGDDRIRQQTAMGAVVTLGRSEPELAISLIDVHIADPELRQQARRQIAEQRGGTDGTAFFTSSIDFPR